MTNHVIRGSDALLWAGVALAVLVGAGAVAVAFIAANRSNRKQEVLEALTVSKRFAVGGSGQQLNWLMQGRQVIPAPAAAATTVLTEVAFNTTAPKPPNVHITPVAPNGLPDGTVVSVKTETATSFVVETTYANAADSLTTDLSINWLAVV